MPQFAHVIISLQFRSWVTSIPLPAEINFFIIIIYMSEFLSLVESIIQINMLKHSATIKNN